LIEIMVERVFTTLFMFTLLNPGKTFIWDIFDYVL
jgi:hypothetical protein